MSSRHSYSEDYPSQHGKCRACSDFKSWAKQQTLSFNEKSKVEKPNQIDMLQKSKECPLDREELGRSTWGFLHTMAAYFPKNPTATQQNNMKQFINLFSEFYPCKECADDLKVEISKSPPAVGGQEELSQWLCKMHNIVNIKLGKPSFDCSKVEERWYTGWRDGSCD